jgi:Rps23 Pro-64 3,4-dihydroxylase Tpa1-like proline 4-hydroxylase
MTPKQVLDSFSQTLLQDERILSPQERALLSAILQHANAGSGANQNMRDAVRTAIASSVGEVVAQRAFAVLGGSIVERILEQGATSAVVESTRPVTEYLGPKDPQPPTGPKPAPLRETPAPAPQTPAEPMSTPKGPQTPHGVTSMAVSQTSVAAAERPQALPARCVVLDEFLAPQELAELTLFTLDHEADFEASEVISPHSEGGVVNYEHRSSRVLMDVGKYQEVMVDRIRTALPQVLGKLGMEEFTIAGVEAQITASNEGDFFHFHSDNGSDRVASRYLTFVYFFHREPRGFDGGELRMHDARLENGEYVSEGTYQTITPQQNQIVFFPCEVLHEITPVKCASRLFADSRFTLNGWLRR